MLQIKKHYSIQPERDEIFKRLSGSLGHWFKNCNVFLLLFKQSKTPLHGVMKNRKIMNYPCLMFQPVSQIVSNLIWQLRLSIWNSQQSIPFQKGKQRQIRGLILAAWWTPTVRITCCWTNSFKGSVCKNHFDCHPKFGFLFFPQALYLCHLAKQTAGKVPGVGPGKEEWVVIVTVL